MRRRLLCRANAMTTVREEDTEFEGAQLDAVGFGAQRAGRYPLQFEGIRHDDEVTLHLEGDVTTQSAPFLRGLLRAVVDLQPQRLVVDLTDVGIVGRDQLRMFSDCAAEIGDFVFRNPSAATRAAMENIGSIDHLRRERQRVSGVQVLISGPPMARGQ